MKLKRCPNSHYYDGDKYDKCPHCAAVSEPAPAPKPVFEPAPTESESDRHAPAPQPAPEPQPVPAPQTAPEPQPAIAPQPAPEPQSVPAPQPAPEPQPVPVPQPASVSQDGEWVCTCGNRCAGKFCAVCGSPRPVTVSETTWMCKCGTENTGKFCFQCGAKKEDSAEAPKPVPAAPAAEPAVQPVQAVSAQQDNTETAKGETLTEQIDEARFTGNMEDARSKTDTRDEGATQIIFDEIGDDLVLGWLTMTNTSGKGKVIPITDAKNTIGRSDPENKVDIDLHNDRSISRGAQATLVYDPLNKKFFLQSAGGKSFVYVNRELVLTFNELQPYDIIRIGETELVFVPLCCDKFSW